MPCAFPILMCSLSPHLSAPDPLTLLSSSLLSSEQIEKLEDVSGTLEELWVSYNQINSLDGLAMYDVLVLYVTLYVVVPVFKNMECTCMLLLFVCHILCNV